MTATEKEQIQHVGDASNILIINNSTDQDWLSKNHNRIAKADRQTENLLSVTVTQSARHRYEVLQNQYSRGLPKTGIISIDGQTELTRTPVSSSSELSFDDVWINTVSPFNLMRVGRNIHTYLQDQTEEDDKTTLFIHSLDTLLEHTDTKQIFRFLHVLTEEIATHGAVGYCQISGDYDRQTITTLRPLFDAVVDVTDDSAYTVKPPIADSWSTCVDQTAVDSESRSRDYVDYLSELTPWLWLVAVVTFGFGDILTTVIGLRTGIATEASPVAADVINANGLGFIYIVKATVFGFFYLIWRLTPPPYKVGVPFGLSLLGMNITIWNISVILISST